MIINIYRQGLVMIAVVIFIIIVAMFIAIIMFVHS